MLENYNLKNSNECVDNLDVNINDANEGMDATLVEVYRKDDLILYECVGEDFGQTISDDVLSEIFPDFEIDPRKNYLIEKDGEIYFE